MRTQNIHVRMRDDGGGVEEGGLFGCWSLGQPGGGGDFPRVTSPYVMQHRRGVTCPQAEWRSRRAVLVVVPCDLGAVYARQVRAAGGGGGWRKQRPQNTHDFVLLIYLPLL